MVRGDVRKTDIELSVERSKGCKEMAYGHTHEHEATITGSTGQASNPRTVAVSSLLALISREYT